MKKQKDYLKIKGFTRLQIVEDGDEIVGDSGWVGPNQVVNLGFQDYIVATIGAIAGSKTASHLAIGTGTVPAAAATSLAGETGTRITSTNTVVASKTLQLTCQFAGSQMGGTCTIQNVGIFNTSSGGTLLAGNTYTTSQWASNQNVNATYQLRFS